MRTGIKKSRLRWIAGLACVMGVFSLVCSQPEGPENQHGELGNLQLKYWDKNTNLSFQSTPQLAVEAMADVTVKTLPDSDGNERGAVDEIVDISFDNNNALAADIVQPDFFTLAALEADRPVMEVEVITESGDVVRDEFFMDTREVAGLDLSDACGDIPNQGGQTHSVGTYNTTYLTGSQVPIDYRLRDESSIILLGYGYFPIDVTGDAELVLDEDSYDTRQFHFQAGTQPGTADIASTVDARRISADIMEPGAIDGATVSNRRQLADLELNATWTGKIVPEVDRQVVCYADIDRYVTSLTPEVCDVEMVGADEDTNDVGDVGTVDEDSSDTGDDKQPSPQPYAETQVQRHDIGECQLEVEFPAGNDGQGATTVISIEDGFIAFTND